MSHLPNPQKRPRTQFRVPPTLLIALNIPFLFLVWPPPANAGPLGRLFWTPEQRTARDQEKPQAREAPPQRLNHVLRNQTVHARWSKGQLEFPHPIKADAAGR